ncbi:MAG TPA: hypothetical protein VG710_01695 [Opitutus sp.]|nr:hypothetical protein [Opitutus sp.]
MPRPSALHRLKRLGAGLLFLLTTIAAASRAFGQTAIVGYTSIWNGTAPATAYPFLSYGDTNTVAVVPFAFNSLGDYTLTSLSLLLRAVPQQGGDLPANDPSPGAGNRPPGFGSDIAVSGALSNVSIGIFSTLPTSLALPTALVSYSFPGSGSAGEMPGIYLFGPSETPTLVAGQTYYLAVSINATSVLEWDMTSGASNGGTFPGDNPVTSLVDDGTSLVYYKITSSGVQSFYDNAGGFALAANAVTAIPEPAAASVLAGAGALALALFVHSRRRHSAPLG